MLPLVALGAAVLVVAVPALWRVLRIAVTLVHELGHAFVGVLVGRRFTGFVLRGDMSGHAVTSGRARGFGRVVTTWAGYPAPAVVGAGLAWVAAQGWAAPTLAAGLALLLFAGIRTRSGLTLLVLVLALAAIGAVWWWRDDALQATALLAVACVLVAGAWRHLGSVWLHGGASSDPRVLAQLTRVPAFAWNLSFAAVCAAATLVLGLEVWSAAAPALGGLAFLRGVAP